MDHNIDEKLIQSIRCYPCLYDRSIFPNIALNRRQAWIDVSFKCKMPLEKCQSRWTSLRNRYVREISKPNPKGFPLFEKLNFLREHIQLRRKRPSNTLDPQSTTLRYSIDEASSSMSMECPLENGLEQEQEQVQEQEQMQQQGHEEDQEYLSDNSSVEFVAKEAVINDSFTDQPMPMPLPLPGNNDPGPALEHLLSFSKIINMLEQALKDKARLEEPQEVFYKYLESILSRVDENTRYSIQMRLLNVAHEEISKAGLS